MDKKDGDFLKHIQEIFRIEAEEHLGILSSGLIELEKGRSTKKSDAIIETMFREIHSLKGAARSVDQMEIESFCHPIESLFAALKRHEISLSPENFDVLYKTFGQLTKIISSGRKIPSAEDSQMNLFLISQLKEVVDLTLTNNRGEKLLPVSELKPVNTINNFSGSEVNTNVSVNPVPANPESVRIQVSKLDPLLFQAEEMIQTKISIDQRIRELKEISNNIKDLKKDLLKRKAEPPSGDKEFGESSETETKFNKLEFMFADLIGSMDRDQYSLNRMVSDHLEEMKRVLMLPVSHLVGILPVMVRDLSHGQKKEAEIIIKGAEIEIDKRILDELKDPLIHLIRNSIDHGLEIPQERLLHNKSPKGIITLEFASKESGTVEITVSDDGKGINIEHVMKAAIRSGYLTAEAAETIDPGQVLSLIYQSGVSTSSIITDISGRGLGLSIVNEKVEKLNGRISVETESNKGTSFRIILPVSLSTFRSIMVRQEDFTFMIPALNVDRILRVEPGDFAMVENHETISIDNKVIYVADLGNVLGLNGNKPANSEKNRSGNEYSDRIHLVVLVSGESTIAFKVDEVIDERQILVKGLGKLLKRVKNISGATVLGTGRVVPVLNISDLIKSASSSASKNKSGGSLEIVADKVKSVLVAEDSITSRTLLKNILETAGYLVTTAFDGVDAFTLALSNDFDLIVSDIDMPRMSGFDLTAKIRSDKKLSELPVVLVTALESREDRERGIEVGADAYIIKSSFDQANLLDIIRKLI